MPQCRCGCKSKASWTVRSIEYDPREIDGKGKEFVEHACTSATLYLQESAYELSFPFQKQYIGDPAFENMARRAF
jgi:hypothetical protein